MKKGAISIEWKTLYGYDSILFALVADARVGVHGQVDVRKYFIRGGHKAVDASLVTRSLAVMKEALILQKEVQPNTPFTSRTLDTSSYLVGLGSATGSVGKASQKPWDYVAHFPESYNDPSVMHILGPLQSAHSEICNAMPFAKLRFLLGVTNKDSFHCDMCRTYVVRRN